MMVRSLQHTLKERAKYLRQQAQGKFSEKINKMTEVEQTLYTKLKEMKQVKCCLWWLKLFEEIIVMLVIASMVILFFLRIRRLLY